ncbi:MAG TPA: bifunctional glycosyltransferase/class I SAM-dependent methyltransferase [Gaiellaceae bacterium]|nr:bifunctional glycosyltransferase/class I SAM-dependent methyltransferase [Gaiellaceae bacterium]
MIALPAYRAEHTLAKTVADIPPGIADEMIVVDDASTDHTVEVAESLGIRVVVHAENRGYGGNQKTCYLQALAGGADVVVLLHPDYQYDPKAVPLLLAPILAGQADMTFGSRFAGQSDPRAGGMPLHRFVGNRVTTVFENALLGSRFTELHSGLRAYTRDCLLSLPFLRYSDDFSFDSQMLVDAATGGQRIVEVPIPTRYTVESSSIDLPRSFRYVAESLRYASAQSARRGRRGRRNPVAWREPRRGPALGGSRRVERPCALCGATEQVLVYPATTSGPPLPGEFGCTSGALALHDDIVQCTACGMVSSVPALDAEGIREAYEGTVDVGYLAEEEGRRQLFAWVLRSLSGYVVPGRRLLELGANVGLFLDVARAAGWDAAGYEPSRWAVESGRRRLGVDLREGVLEDVDEPPGSFDAVVALDVLEHLVDPLAALRRLGALAGPDGLVTLSTVNVSSIHARLRKERWPWLIRPHLHYFSPETLHAMLLAAGLRPVEWDVVPRSFHVSYVASRLGSNLGPLGPAAAAVSRVADVRVPVGRLGDVVLVHARQDRRGG